MQPHLIKITSNNEHLRIALLHKPPETPAGNLPVLLLHGATFPSALSYSFRMGGNSWMDHLSANNFDSYALDFLGYGDADRYPEMQTPDGAPTGRAMSVYLDVDKAVNYILEATKQQQLILIGHSWGATVAALYAEKFPDKIKKLVLFAPITARKTAAATPLPERTYDSMTPDQRVQAMADLTPPGKTGLLETEIFTDWKKDWLQSDVVAVKSDQAVVHFPSGPSYDVHDLKHGKSYYHPGHIKAETLIIRGEWDQYPNHDDAQQLFNALPEKTIKKYLVIPQGTHVMHLEQCRHQLYEAVLRFITTTQQHQSQTSIAVIFEVIPQDGSKQDYLDIAAALRPSLEQIDGFISIERFQSLANPGKILSLSFWRDEQAVYAWRNLELHRQAQEKGRNGIFSDYHLRIAHVVRDYGMFDRSEAPTDSWKYHH